MSDQDIKKATRHVNQNEGLIFERSSPGKRAYRLPPLDVPEVDYKKALGSAARQDLGNMPEVSEMEIIRHFTRISTWNYAIDLGMYPLGSCTMKYNARVNEVVARLRGLADAHPYQPERISQGALRIMKTLADCLLDITGMDAITLQPAAGAHGEMTGILLMHAYLEAKGNPRKKILIPDSAHGTNPATAAICGYAVENLKSNSHGMVDIVALANQMNEDVAGLMLTNPNTLGIFEREIDKIAEILHRKGGLLYMDGANMNALVGKTRPGDFGVDVMHLNLHKTFSTPHGGGGPGSGPVACKKGLEPFLPKPMIVEKADILHRKGGLLYMDGANMNALVGKTRPGDFGVDVMHLNLHKTFSTPHGGGGPGSGPVACKKGLEPFLPKPMIVEKADGTLGFDYDRPQSVGRVRMFYGNFGMHVRALAYIMANGYDGLRQTTEDAVLNANYIRRKLEEDYELPYKSPSMHEVVFSDRLQAQKGVKTGDIAKRLIDYGFHPYTVSFPLVVPGALMIEPTESESLEELDLFIDAMKAISREAEEDPELIRSAPHSTRVSRLDETAAARKPVLRWKPAQATSAAE